VASSVVPVAVSASGDDVDRGLRLGHRAVSHPGTGDDHGIQGLRAGLGEGGNNRGAKSDGDGDSERTGLSVHQIAAPVLKKHTRDRRSRSRLMRCAITD
jgi:hypothetical protein